MTRFIAGVAITLLVQAVGWPRIEAATQRAQAAVARAYTAAASEVK